VAQVEVSASAFYSWLKTPEDSEKAQRKVALDTKARQLFNNYRQTYGYRRLSNELHPKDTCDLWL
jgi:putative transposase